MITFPCLRRRSAGRRGRSLLDAWSLLHDDPPGLCCDDDELCPACAERSRFAA